MNNSYLDKFAIGTEYKDVVVPVKEIYRDENGWSIYIVKNEKECEFRIKGVFITPLNINHQYKVKGVISSFRNENDFKVKDIVPIRPKSKKSIILYLKTLKGLKSRADVIYETYGDEAIDVLLNRPDKVANDIKGIGIKIATNWSNQLQSCFESQDTISRLLELELTPKAAKKLYDEYKEEIIAKIETNPYFLINEVKGYGFDKCDRVARELGISPEDKFRVQEGIIYILKKASSEGHCYLPKHVLIDRTKSLLDIKLQYTEMKRFESTYREQESFEYFIGEKNKYIIQYEDLLQHINLYEAENKKKDKEAYRYVIHDISLESIEKAINELSKTKRIIVEEDEFVYLQKLYKSEVDTAYYVRDLADYKDIYSKNYVEEVLNKILKRDGIILEEMQRKACIDFNTSESGFYLLLGSAGTGKTFNLIKVLEVAKTIAKEKHNKALNISIFAPTGRASKIAALATKMPCSTIHKGLGWKEGGFEHNKYNKLDADIVICDESSMLDINLAKSLFEAIRRGSKVILMGDIKQLPSVGPGAVLKDLIDSNILRVVILNVIKRQGLLSGTVKYANTIIEDKMIPNSVDTGDAFYLERKGIRSIQNTVIQAAKNLINNKGYDFNDIQILIPQKTGSLGVYMMNFLLQKEFNNKDKGNKNKILATKFSAKPDESSKAVEFELYFTEGDKVINIHNNYSMQQYLKNGDNFIKTTQCGITNGETGVIEYIKIDKDQDGKITKKIMVKYDEFYCLYEDEFSDLQHSFALTTHKSQGSAWKAIIVPMDMRFFKLLDNNLFYTAITRARDFVCVIGDKKAINLAIRTHNAIHRYTRLSYRLKNSVYDDGEFSDKKNNLVV